MVRTGALIAGAWLAWALPIASAPRLPVGPASPGPENVLKTFLKALADQDVKSAHTHVAPETKEKGDPIAYQAKADFNSFETEAKSQAHQKFAKYKLGEQRTDGNDKYRIWIHFDGGDNDEALLVRVKGRWYVADPIHIIR
jgi:hypothetical protein